MRATHWTDCCRRKVPSEFAVVFCVVIVQIQATPLRDVRWIQIHEDLLAAVTFRKVGSQESQRVVIGNLDLVSLFSNSDDSFSESLPVETRIHAPRSGLGISAYRCRTEQDARAIAPVQIKRGKSEIERAMQGWL